MNVPDVRAGAQRGCEISFLGGIDDLTNPSKLIRVGPAGVLGKKLQAPSNLNHAMMQYLESRAASNVGRISFTAVTVALFQINTVIQCCRFFAVADKVEPDQPACFWKPLVCRSNVGSSSLYSQYRMQQQDSLAENLQPISGCV